MIRRILVGLDGSAPAREAVAHAAVLARAFDAELVLLRVLEPAHDDLFGPLGALHWKLSRAEARTALEESATALSGQGLKVRAELEEGKPAEQIIDFARAHDCDLIVLASHGEGGVSQFRLGSTAHKVTAESGLSIFLLRGAAPAATGGSEEEAVDGVRLYRRILVPLDGSPRGEWALCLAASIARGQRAELLLLSVVPTAEAIAPTPHRAEDRDLREELRARATRCAEEHVEEQRRKLTTPDLTVRTMVRPARRVAQAISEVAEQEAVDLVVLCAHGSGGQAPWPYGSVTSRLLMHDFRPLLIFQDQAIRELATVQPETRSQECCPPRGRISRRCWTRQYVASG